MKFGVIAEPGRPEGAFGEDLCIPGMISAISQHFPNTEPPPLPLTAAGTEEPKAGGEGHRMLLQMIHCPDLWDPRGDIGAALGPPDPLSLKTLPQGWGLSQGAPGITGCKI